MKRAVLLIVAISFTVFSFAQDAAEKLNQAQEALKAKDYAKAFSLYDDAMSNIGDVQVDASINYNIGFAAYKAGNLEGAVKYFDKAIATGTNVSKCHEYKALAYNAKKDYKNAVASFELAIATSEEGSDALVFNAAIAAYRGKMNDKAVELFGKSVENGYKGATAQYYKAAVLKKQKKNEEYKAALEFGAEKFPGDKKISPALAKIYVSEGNVLYKAGAAILTAANEKVNAGSLKTDDAAYTAEVDKAKVEFKAAVEILEKAKALDSTNANAQKLIDACKAVL
ncbi:MAG: tetratricopeptide repeat protein [Draconibacterium sp.]|nr:tetratricopeptide repeat protein [Draconibacterium sp.]